MWDGWHGKSWKTNDLPCIIIKQPKSLYLHTDVYLPILKLKSFRVFADCHFNFKYLWKSYIVCKSPTVRENGSKMFKKWTQFGGFSIQWRRLLQSLFGECEVYMKYIYFLGKHESILKTNSYTGSFEVLTGWIQTPPEKQNETTKFCIG